MSTGGGDDPLLGTVLLGKLRVDARIGEGAMGAVYRVQHLVTNHARALKVLHSRAATDEQALVRFLREAGVSGVLKSPYVVETVDAGRLDDGSVYVLMELLEGRSLADVFDEGPMQPARLAGLLEQACRGLGAAHAAGIVHRDLKPENLFVSRDDTGAERIKILDFGIAKFRAPTDLAASVTDAGTAIGTPYYMAPEQMGSSKAVDPRADVWSLGVILYEGLAGRRPFESETFPELVVQVCTGAATPIEALRPGLPAIAGEVIARTMARDLEARYATVEALSADLRKLAEGELGAVRIDPLGRTAPSIAAPQSVAADGQTRRMAPWLVVGAAAVAVGTVALILTGPGAEGAGAARPATSTDDGSSDAGAARDAGPRDAGRPRDAWIVPSFDASPLPREPGSRDQGTGRDRDRPRGGNRRDDGRSERDRGERGGMGMFAEGPEAIVGEDG